MDIDKLWIPHNDPVHIVLSDTHRKEGMNGMYIYIIWFVKYGMIQNYTFCKIKTLDFPFILQACIIIHSTKFCAQTLETNSVATLEKKIIDASCKVKWRNCRINIAKGHIDIHVAISTQS